MTEKHCRACDQMLPVTRFKKERRCKDGRQPTCRKCCEAGKGQKQRQAGQTKPCSKCQQVKPNTTEFFVSAPTTLGTGSWCRDCAAAHTRQARKAKRDQKKFPEGPAPEGQKRCLGCRSCFPATSEFFYNQKTKGYSYLSSECKTCLIARTKVYNARIQADPSRRAALNIRQTNKARLRRGRPGSHTPAQVLEKLAAQQGKCYYCAAEMDEQGMRGKNWQVEHFIPLSRGGTNDIENIVLACVACNQAKKNLMPWEWMPTRFAPQALN